MNLLRRLLDSLAPLVNRLQATKIYRAYARQARPDVQVHEASEQETRRVLEAIFPGSGNEYTARPEVTPFVALHGGVPVGFVELVRRIVEGDRSCEHWLYSLHVRNRYRGMGIGADLCNAVIARAVDERAERLLLSVMQDNLRAQQLYRKLDFTVLEGEALAALHLPPDSIAGQIIMCKVLKLDA